MHFSYKHALDGVIRVTREEGLVKLFNGAQWASSRAVMVTVGQLCFYDVIKGYLLTTPYFKDNLTTHFTSSLGAVSILPSSVYTMYITTQNIRVFCLLNVANLIQLIQLCVFLGK